MSDDERVAHARFLIGEAERLDELGDTAELMDDEDTAERLRRRARHQRAMAFALLDDHS